jgi:competence protein ComEC
MLLTGDIERGAEAELARADLARADVLLVPHHGSRTSSSAEFLAAVQARHAVAAVGYRSRFGHPHPEVLGRYAAAGLDPLRTDRDGAVTVRLAAGAPGLAAERARRARYWHVPPPGA